VGNETDVLVATRVTVSLPLPHPLDQIGVFAREVEDVARVLGVIAGRDSHDATTADVPVPDYAASLTANLKGARLGFPRALFGKGLDDEVKNSVESVVDVYRDLGAEIVDVELPNAGYAIAVYYIIATAEASSNLARFDGVRYGFRAEDAPELRQMYRKTRAEGFGPEVKRRIMLGTYVLSRRLLRRLLSQSTASTDLD
jgi:aspartyl-tRNA(Asn)/glutamyl-tRNA(Gln) amidotransferase subunit A